MDFFLLFNKILKKLFKWNIGTEELIVSSIFYIINMFIKLFQNSQLLIMIIFLTIISEKLYW